LGRGGGIEEQGLQQERARRRPHQSTVQTTPLKLLRLNDQLALRGDDEAPERVKKRVLQYKHLAARPAAYITDEVIKPQQAIDLMRLSRISQADGLIDDNPHQSSHQYALISQDLDC
jgi:hypothetical protein